MRSAKRNEKEAGETFSSAGHEAETGGAEKTKPLIWMLFRRLAALMPRPRARRINLPNIVCAGLDWITYRHVNQHNVDTDEEDDYINSNDHSLKR